MSEAVEGTLFKAEYEREMENWLRRRFGWLLGATIGWEVVSLFISIGTMLWMKWAQSMDDGSAKAQRTKETLATLEEQGALSPQGLALLTVGTILGLMVAARAFVWVRPRLETREQTLRAATWFIVQIGALSFAAETAMALMATRAAVGGLGSLLFFHFAASLFLPWSPRESMRPMYLLIALFVTELMLLRLAGKISGNEVIWQMVGIPITLVPGLLVSAWRLRRHRARFDRQMVDRGFRAMRKELSQARAVQMALFPRPVHTPELDFDYAYVPANEVGGDFVHASVDEKGRLDVVLMDVTGHGLASALTVARLSGEVERLLAEDPDIEPVQVLRALNRYCALTLAKHNVYVTAIALQADPQTGEVKYANAGHPPAYVRRGDGSLERFDSTTWVLGACPDSLFEAEQTILRLAGGDTMVLVTDGVHEAPDRKGRQFGLDRLQETIVRAPAQGRWSTHIAEIVDNWRGRLGEDDLLVATIRLPTAKAPLPRARTRAQDIEMGTAMGLDAATLVTEEPKSGIFHAGSTRSPDAGASGG